MKLKGFGLIETLLSITILAIITTLVSSVFIDINRSNITSDEHIRANRMLSEGIEAMRSIRDQNFLYLTNGQHGLLNTAGVWSLNGSSDVNGIYTRQVTIGDVYRNMSGDIDSAGTELDERIKNVLIEVSWESSLQGTQTVQNELLFSDWEAQESIDTNSSEWNEGEFFQTEVGGTGGESLVLATDVVSWEESFNSASYIFTNNANGNAITVVGETGYLVSSLNGQVDNFTVIDVSDPSDVTTIGSLLLAGNAYDIDVIGNYAYVATVDNNAELQTIDISNPASPTVADIDDTAGTKAAISLFVEGDKLYLGTERDSDAEFFVYSIQTPDDPVLLGSFEIGDHVEDIEVYNDIAYIAVAEGPSFRILDCSTPASITQLAGVYVNAEDDGKAITYFQDEVFFGTGRAGSEEEFYIFDVSTPSSPVEIGAFEVDTSIQDIGIFGQEAYITTIKVNEEFQVIDMSDYGNIQLEATIDLGADGNEVTADQDAIYITSNDNTSALFLLTHPVEEYYGEGTYTSRGLDSGSDSTIWLTYNWEGELPAATSVEFQLRFADTEANLENATWTGPDGTAGTRYSGTSNVITLPSGVSGTRWMQYIAYLTGDNQYSPEIYSVRIQFSP